MLEDITSVLACPVCGLGMELDGGALRCASAHSFDVARHGYVNLLRGPAPGWADSAAMVAAREAFLDAGHYAVLTDLLAERAAALTGDPPTGDTRIGVPPTGRPLVLDAGAGTGHHLRAVLDSLPGAVGLALDVSKHAARRAARAHPHAAAIVCDLWRSLPVRSQAASIVLDVFSPRSADEFRRVLRPDGALLVVTPALGHFAELVATLGLLTVDARKEERLEQSLSGRFRLERREPCEVGLTLGRGDVDALVRMGPSAHHLDEGELRSRLAELPEPVTATASFVLWVWRPA